MGAPKKQIPISISSVSKPALGMTRRWLSVFDQPEECRSKGRISTCVRRPSAARGNGGRCGNVGNDHLGGFPSTKALGKLINFHSAPIFTI